MAEISAPRISPIVRSLLVVMGLVGILQLLLPSFNQFCLEYLSLRLRVGEEWQPWRLYGFVTYAFVHGGVTHLFLNCLWLLLIGQAVTQWLGARYFLAVFFGGAFAGGALQMLLSAGATLVGASGGLFALLGAFGYRHIALNEVGRKRRIVVLRFLVIMTIMIVIFATPALSPVGENVSWAGHLGGLIAGTALMPWAMKRSMRKSMRKSRFNV